MDFRERMRSRFAGQLGRPHGLPGRLVGRLLDRVNGDSIAAAVDALDIPPGAVLADLGFGGGIGLELLLQGLQDGGQVYGVDQSTAMLAAAARRFRHEIATGQLSLHQAQIERLPLATASIDGAITLNTLYFITDLASAFKECARVLKPSGQLVVGIGDPDAMAGRPIHAHGLQVRSLAEVSHALLDAGLELDQHRRVGTDEGVFHLLVAQPY